MMFEPIRLTVLGHDEHLTGFKFWWLKSVVGYDTSVHCARCLRGKYDRRVNRTMRLNSPVDLVGDLVYLCGVSPRWINNFHAAVQYEQGASFDLPTYNGLVVRFENGRLIPIQPLEPGYRGLDKSFTTCRNFQFAVQMNDAIAARTSASRP